MTDTKAEALSHAKLVVDGLFNFGPGLTEHDRIVFIAGVIEQAREEGARELLADSKRFQWIIANGVQRLDDLYDACNWEPRPGQIEALIDAEIEAGR